MPSQTKENYLKTIYFLCEKEGVVSLSALSKEMEVSKPTANNMVKKLQEKAWVISEKYKPIQLSNSGLKMAALIIRKHRIAEMFLAEKMGFGWEEVHDIAEEMEHLESDVLFQRMDELLGFPKLDPHGSPIPDKDGNFEKYSYLTLTEVEEGREVQLAALANSSSDLLHFLNKKSIALGSKMKVIGKENFDNSITVEFENSKLTLSSKVSKHLLVLYL